MHVSHLQYVNMCINVRVEDALTDKTKRYLEDVKPMSSYSLRYFFQVAEIDSINLTTQLNMLYLKPCATLYPSK